MWFSEDDGVLSMDELDDLGTLITLLFYSTIFMTFLILKCYFLTKVYLFPG